MTPPALHIRERSPSIAMSRVTPTRKTKNRKTFEKSHLESEAAKYGGGVPAKVQLLNGRDRRPQGVDRVLSLEEEATLAEQGFE